MHPGSLYRMHWFVNTFLVQPQYAGHIMSILDIGSYDVNGSYKQLFPESLFSYTGLDMESGPNVDIVPANAYSWTEVPDKSYDVVICGQVFEHAEFFWITMSEMVRVLKNGGLICIIAPRTIGLHRYPVDCYRFNIDGLIALAKYTNLDVIHASCDSAPPGSSSDWYDSTCRDSFLIAMKPVDWAGVVNLDEYVFEKNDLETLSTGFITREEYINLLNRINRNLEKLD